MNEFEKESLGDIIHALRQALEALKPVESIEVLEPSSNAYGADAAMDVFTKDGAVRLNIKTRPSGEPRYIREASFVLNGGFAGGQRAEYGVVIAPYISPEAREILRKEGQGWFDRAGNCLLSFLGIHLEIVKADINPFSTRRKHGSIFSPKAARILKLLLEESAPLKGNEIAQKAQVSQAQVSKVREALLDREWAVSDKTGIRIVKPMLVLEAWRETRLPPKLLTQGYTLLHGKALETHLQTLFMRAQAIHDQTLLLAGHSVARRIAPYARVNGEYFYADERGVELISEYLKLDPIEHGANVFIYEPEDDMLSLDAIALLPPPIRGTGLIQTYLDLSSMGDRDKEAADYLLTKHVLSAFQKV